MLGTTIAISKSRAGDPSSSALFRDGSTFERAFIVEAAEPERTQWETSQALKTHPRLSLPSAVSRKEVSHMGRLYHVLKIQWGNGTTTTIYFKLGPDVPGLNEAMQLVPRSHSSIL